MTFVVLASVVVFVFVLALVVVFVFVLALVVVFVFVLFVVGICERFGDEDVIAFKSSVFSFRRLAFISFCSSNMVS